MVVVGAYRRRSHKAPTASRRSGGRSDRFFLGGRSAQKKAKKRGQRGHEGGLEGKGQDAGSRHLAGGGALPAPGKQSFQKPVNLVGPRSRCKFQISKLTRFNILD